MRNYSASPPSYCVELKIIMEKIFWVKSQKFIQIFWANYWLKCFIWSNLKHLCYYHFSLQEQVNWKEILLNDWFHTSRAFIRFVPMNQNYVLTLRISAWGWNLPWEYPISWFLCIYPILFSVFIHQHFDYQNKILRMMQITS